MKKLDMNRSEKNISTNAGNYRLEWFNGVTWEVGHPAHWNITKDDWLKMQAEFKANNKNTRWRLVHLKIVERGNY